MPAEIFVDTSAWYALAVSSAREHEDVRDALAGRVRRGVLVVTTNLVLAESHALLVRRVGREMAQAFVREVMRPPNMIVRSDEGAELSALTDWIDRYSDQDFSFTDAVSFATMRRRGIREALALDTHFSVAGFQVVPSQRGRA